MREDSAHAGGAEQNGSQWLIDDVREHRSDSEEREIGSFEGASKKQGQAHMGEEEHFAWLSFMDI